MKIGIDARFYGGEQSKGLGRYTQKLVEHLCALNREHEYVLFVQEETYRLLRGNHERVHYVRAPFRWYTLAEQLWMPLLIAHARVDLMHFPHFNVPLWYRKPFIVTIHDLIITHFPTERATTLGPLVYRFKHYAGQWVMRHAVHGAAVILTVSQFSKDDIVKHFHCDPSRVMVTYEGVEQLPRTCRHERHDVFLHELGIRQPFFLSVGNAYPHKNLEILLDVLLRWQRVYRTVPFQFVFVGRRDYFYDRLRDAAWRKNIEQHVVFPGFLRDDDLWCLYRYAVAYLFPSLYEGFGLPALEAMRAGIPVLAARASCLPEIWGDAAIFFDPTDISAIIKAIHHVWHDSSLLNLHVMKGYRQVEKYSWHRMAKETLAVYEQYARK